MPANKCPVCNQWVKKNKICTKCIRTAKDPGPLQSWQQKIQCAKCKDIIWSKWSGEFVSCTCGAIFVDQTPHYSRWGGNPADFIRLEKDKQ